LLSMRCCVFGGMLEIAPRFSTSGRGFATGGITCQYVPPPPLRYLTYLIRSWVAIMEILFISRYMASLQIYVNPNINMKVIIIRPLAAIPLSLTPALGLSFCTKSVEVAAVDEQLAVPKL